MGPTALSGILMRITSILTRRIDLNAKKRFDSLHAEVGAISARWEKSCLPRSVPPSGWLEAKFAHHTIELYRQLR